MCNFYMPIWSRLGSSLAKVDFLVVTSDFPALPDLQKYPRFISGRFSAIVFANFAYVAHFAHFVYFANFKLWITASWLQLRAPRPSSTNERGAGERGGLHALGGGLPPPASPGKCVG